MRILVVEDEARLAGLLRRGLAEEGRAVDLADGGEAALDWVAIGDYDAIVLDVMLPDLDRLAVCRRLRRGHVAIPILLSTARDAVADRVAGLDAGADDYLVKPFAFADLAARLRALARRPAETVGRRERRGPPGHGPRRPDVPYVRRPPTAMPPPPLGPAIGTDLLAAGRLTPDSPRLRRPPLPWSRPRRIGRWGNRIGRPGRRYNADRRLHP